MDMEKRLATLNKWYEIYNEFLAGIDVACEKGCAACCTCNVTGTTLEGLLIYDHLEANNGLEPLATMVSAAPEGRFQPAITLNQMVEMCVNDLQIPEETNDPEAGHCQWLEDDICPIYTVRPFACRAMCSLENCKTTGEAQMPPLVLSANNVLMQYIEALDRPGCSGNLTDVLSYLSAPDNRNAYIEGRAPQFPSPLKPNLGFQVLMMPPEHRQKLAPLIEAIDKVVQQPV